MSEIESLWGDEFVIPDAKEKTKKIVAKITKPKVIKEMTIEKQLKSKTVSLETKLALIKREVYRVLGKQKDNLLCITDFDTFHKYISRAIEVGRIDIDTETNKSLDPITCKLMGPCIYVPGEKQAYVPLNHRDPLTKIRLPWQLTEEIVRQEFQRLVDNNVKIIMHNGEFDYSVIKCTCGIALPIYWDTMIAANLIDENEEHGLKALYVKYIDPDQEKYSINRLFEGVDWEDIDPEIFTFYAATDAMMTDKLYEYQLKIMNSADFIKIKSLFFEVEMPLIQVLAEMELAGMDVDQEYATRLSNKYHKKLEKLDAQISVELSKLQPQINAWKLTPEANARPLKKKKGSANIVGGPGYIGVDPLQPTIDKDEYGKSKAEQLENPINMASPTQLAILLYDILKCPVVSKKSPRGTGSDELEAIAKKTNLPICNLMVKRRELVKLISTYVDVIPELAKSNPDGRIRTHFNQYGAATGRLSSSRPINFQNIPSHEKTIRLLFRAKPGYKIIGSDYSGQEPKTVAHYSQDPNMIEAYNTGRDLYSVIASLSFDMPYEECLEFYPEGTEIIYEGQKIITGKKTHQNKAGKERRTAAKSVLLGILYGRGAASVGEQLNKSREEAQAIFDNFYKAFPAVKNWMDEALIKCRKLGYVEGLMGRRRRLPDINLPKFEFKYIDESKAPGIFNPFVDCVNKKTEDKLMSVYSAKLGKCRSKQQIEAVKQEAVNDNLQILDNGGFIAQAERQVVNAMVQGGAATMTKRALSVIYKDQRLRDIGARLVNTVHDEILIEAPEEYAEQAAQYLTQDMADAAHEFAPELTFNCDPYIVSNWYSDEYAVGVEKKFKDLTTGDPKKNIEPISKEEAFEIVAQEFEETLPEDLKKILAGYLN